MFLDKGDEQMDTENHPIVKFASKHFPVTAKSHGHDFFVRQQVVETSSHQDGSKSRSLEVSKSKLMMTPLFLVLLVIEFSDIIFAVDSIPAVFSVTKNPVIVYTSNIFAIMGLRSLFFLLSDVADRFWMLHYGLGVLLTFIGVKMICGEFFDWHIPTLASLAVILGILVFSILLSMLIKKPQRMEV
jgi:tellurite resistance protein TerC